MSSFEIVCPLCSRHVMADSRLSGQTVNCPGCAEVFEVPPVPQVKTTLWMPQAEVSPFTGIERAGPASPKSKPKSEPRQPGHQQKSNEVNPIRLAAWLFILVVIGSVSYWAYCAHEEAIEDERELLVCLIDVDESSKMAHRVKEMWAVNYYEKSIRETTPKIQAIYRRHPSWRNNPPISCKPYLGP